MIAFKEIKESLLHLLFPQICAGGANDLVDKDSVLCMRCMSSLPETGFEKFRGNPVEKIFWGRLKIESATAQFYFTKDSLMQRLMHQFKYKGNKAIGLQLGKIMGKQLQISGNFVVDALVPLPLFAAKQKKRGYNQATVLCEGISLITGIPVLDKAVIRPAHTETQTKKNRIERWKNIEGRFVLSGGVSISGKHVLLVDDVVTTGATLESCGSELLQAEGLKLSIATLCIASRQ